jgi:hypothetical protein
MQLANWNGFKIDPRNTPLPRPGLYQFTNLANGKLYIGVSKNLVVRGREHFRSISQVFKRTPKFVRALRKYGAASFLYIPIAYSLSPIQSWKADGLWLSELETELILAGDTINSGYNVLQNWYGGPAGDEFKRIMEAVWSDPEYRRKHSAGLKAFLESPAGQLKRRTYNFRTYWARLSPSEREAFFAAREPARLASVRTDEYRAKISQAGKRVWSDPAHKEQRSATIRKAWSDSDLRQEQSDRLKSIFTNDPELLARRREQVAVAQVTATKNAQAKLKGGRWITDGTVNRRLAADEPIPPGWNLGRIFKPGVKPGPKPRYA